METKILESVATHEFTINIAKKDDVVEAFYITKIVMAEFLKRSIVHKDIFINYYEMLQNHAENGTLYILKNRDISLGMMTFGLEEPEEFKQVNWESNEASSLYISRIFVLPHWRNKGIGSFLLSFAEERGREKGFKTIRLDITSDFDEGNMLLMKHNYQFVGNIFNKFQKTPLNCYEKII